MLYNASHPRLYLASIHSYAHAIVRYPMTRPPYDSVSNIPALITALLSLFLSYQIQFEFLSRPSALLVFSYNVCFGERCGADGYTVGTEACVPQM